VQAFWENETERERERTRKFPDETVGVFGDKLRNLTKNKLDETDGFANTKSNATWKSQWQPNRV